MTKRQQLWQWHSTDSVNWTSRLACRATEDPNSECALFLKRASLIRYST